MSIVRLLRSALFVFSILAVLSITGFGTWVSWSPVISYGRSLPSQGLASAATWIPITVLAIMVFLGGGLLWFWGIQTILDDIETTPSFLRFSRIILKIVGCGLLGTVVIYAFLTMG